MKSNANPSDSAV